MAADHARQHFEAEAAKTLREAIELEEAWQRAEKARRLSEAEVQCLHRLAQESTSPAAVLYTGCFTSWAER